MGTNQIIGYLLALTFFLILCMPCLSRADTVTTKLSSTDWPFQFPGLCPPHRAGNPQEFMMTLSEVRTRGANRYRYTWARLTDCETVSPISKVEVVMVSEPHTAVLLSVGGMAVYTLKRLGLRS